MYQDFHFLSMSLMFCLMTLSFHPIILGILIILQALLIASFICSMFCISWFSILIFIVYLGGILMIFSYFISISKNEQKFFEKQNFVFFFLIMCIISFSYSYSFSMKVMPVEKMNLKETLYSMFSYTLMNLSVFLMILLLFSMICIVFITEKSKGNMKSM